MNPERIPENWGECFLQHFIRFMSDPVNRAIFRENSDGPAIQILAFDGVFPGCRVFSSLGLTHFEEMIGRVAEVFVPVDSAWDDAPELIANALFFVVQQRMEMGCGTCVGGLEVLCPDFVQHFRKTALYFTRPYSVPEQFSTVTCAGRKGALLSGVFISREEREYLMAHGRDDFEDLLAKADVDPYHLARKSII